MNEAHEMHDSDIVRIVKYCVVDLERLRWTRMVCLRDCCGEALLELDCESWRRKLSESIRVPVRPVLQQCGDYVRWVV